MVSRVNGPFFIDHVIIKIYNDKIIKIGCFLISLFALIGPYYMDPKSGSSSSIYKILQKQQYRMAKKNSQSKPKNKHNKKKQALDKDKMKQILQYLSANKNKNHQITSQLKSITSLNKVEIEKRKNRKTRKDSAQPQSMEIQLPNQDSQIDQENIQEIPQQKVNIFAMNQFVSDKPVVLNNQKKQDQYQLDLESRARKLLGEGFNTEKFGDKPMKPIEEKDQMIPEDEQDNKKKLPHPLLKIPNGNYQVHRSKQIEEFREKLPIYMKEQEIIEAINHNLVTLVCGQTGSGKSTQLPQFLTQKNYQQFGKIAITQPRRLATTSLAQRVSAEMNMKLGDEIGYQVRHQKKLSAKSFIKFMTDGILLRQMSSDPMLLEYSVIIIDEAHERKINTDILIGLLSRLILVRYKLSLENKCEPLRLVIMSATLRIQDFKNTILFGFEIPILNVESKMYPVTIFHEKSTPDNYIDCAVKKCVKIQKQLPPGDVLVFLTGKDEIHEMSIKLQQALERLSFEIEHHRDDDEDQMVQGEQMVDQGHHYKISGFNIHKLYSSLPSNEQQKIFLPTSQGFRKFIISTNIAETSITVPNIRYVIDSGQQKHRFFDGVWRWKKGWGSKAMAAQRSGRAGRTAHGYCYRLYSSALYANIMEEYPEPEINKQPLESVILQIKAIGYNDTFTFPFPTPPDRQSIMKGLQGLHKAEAITGEFTGQADKTSITPLGKVISFIPLAPRLAKMLLIGRKRNVQCYILLICILLTVQQIFAIKSTAYPQHYDQQQINFKISERKQQYNQFIQTYQKYIQKRCGDIFTAVNVVGEFMSRIISQFKDIKQSQIKKQTNIFEIIRHQASSLKLNQNVMREFYYNCDQICEIYETLTENSIDLTTYSPPSPDQISEILDIMLVSFPENICKIEKNNQYINRNSEKVYIHRLSSLYKLQHDFVGCVDFFSNLGNRKYMRYPFLIRNYSLMAKFGTIGKPSSYVWMDDQIVGKAEGTVYGWPIPNLIVRELEGETKYFQMAKLFLNGKIFPEIGLLTEKNLLNSSVSTIRPDNLQQKVQMLVYVFRMQKITAKSQLLTAFTNDQHFLEKQLKLWVNSKNFEKLYKTLRNKILNN